MRLRRIFFIALAGASLAATGAHAQYEYDPGNLDEQGDKRLVYGAVRDDSGRYVIGATLVVDKTNVFHTDETGRYAGNFPPGPTGQDAPVVCSKPGYSFVRLDRRIGESQGKPWIEADCYLRKG